jgi:hypothetical protein
MKKTITILFLAASHFAFGQTVEGIPNNTVKVRNNSTSIIANGKPLYVIDGKIMEVTADDKEDVLSKINPDDIEMMDVLKGEKAIAEYGEKGKYGVVKITMKKKK